MPFLALLLWATSLEPAHSPIPSTAKVSVLVFVRTDCPITNRYAPELKRIAEKYADKDVRFWLVYPDRTETEANIRKQMGDFVLPGEAITDPSHALVKKAHATVAPEVAVFDSAERLMYHGRIDNRWIAPGKSRPQATVHDLEDAIQTVLNGRRPFPAETRSVGCALADVE